MIDCNNIKILESKGFLEVWHYQDPVFSGYIQIRKKKKRRAYEDLTGPEKVDALKRRINYYKNKRHEILRIVDCNFDEHTSFLTLTQREDCEIGEDIEKGNYEFDKFIRRLKRWLKKNRPGAELKYLATWERTQSGKVHYHLLLFSCPYIPADIIADKWRHGFIKINKVDHVSKDKRALYITKYFTKDLAFKDARKKAYFKSRNLKVPDEFKFLVQEDAFDISMFGDPDFSSEYMRMDYITQKESKVEYYKIPKILSTDETR